MNDIAREYLGPVNGNGNGNGKIFDLAPKVDPILSQVVPAVRRKVCQNTRLTEGARMFFCYLTDMSLLNGKMIRRGVVMFSDQDLAHRFNRDERTIRNWKRALEAMGEVWLTEKWMKNTFPQTVYNITAIVGQATFPMNVESDGGCLPEDDVFRTNRKRQLGARHDRATGKFVCRVHGLSNCPDCRRRTPPGPPLPTAPAENLQKTEENGTDGKFLPPTTANDCRPPRQIIAAHGGKSLPSPTANDCRPARKIIAAVGGKSLPLSAANDCRRGRPQIADNRETGDVSSEDTEGCFKRSTGLNARKSAGGAKKLNSENLFLLDVGAMMEAWKKGSSRTELTGSGAWWRMCFRQQPDLMRRVLAETHAMVKEGKIKFNPGSAAVDLFKRWGGVQNQRKQRTAAATAAR